MTYNTQLCMLRFRLLFSGKHLAQTVALVQSEAKRGRNKDMKLPGGDFPGKADERRFYLAEKITTGKKEERPKSHLNYAAEKIKGRLDNRNKPKPAALEAAAPSEPPSESPTASSKPEAESRSTTTSLELSEGEGGQ